MYQSRKAIRTGNYASHDIQTKDGQIRQIILGKRLILQMGVNAPQAPQPAAPCTVIRQRRDGNTPVVANYDIFYIAGPLYQYAYLTIDLPRQLGNISG
jgi:hypothetical protein